MKIINCTHTKKGGVGKTTTSINLSLELHKENRVILIDTDKSKQSIKFGIAREFNTLEIRYIDTQSLMQSFMELDSRNYDYIIIDSGGYESELNTYAINISDIIIIPTTDSSSDYTQALELVSDISETTLLDNDYTQIKLLVNKVRYNSTKFHQDLIKEFDGIDKISVFNTIIAENRAYKTMIDNGLGVREITNNKRVNKDIFNLALEVEEC